MEDRHTEISQLKLLPACLSTLSLIMLEGIQLMETD